MNNKSPCINFRRGGFETRPYILSASRGFNLLELLLVVVIIGILASIALPNYTKSKEHALGKEAIANLKIIAAAERIAKLETGSYQICGCWNNGSGGSGTGDCGCNHPTLGCNKVLNLDLSANNWAYYVGMVGGGVDFHANAARQGSGGYYDCLYGVFSTTEPAIESGSGTCP